MEEISTDYYVTLKPTKEGGVPAKGAHGIAYVNDPAVEEFGIYLQRQDQRIVATEDIQEAILDYLDTVGMEQPAHWVEVSEEEYLQAKEVHLTTDPTARESFNDVSKGDGTGQWLVRYKYQGPEDSKNRSFCARILAKNRIYTEEEIKNGLSNPEFGSYSIWDYKGSYGCRHKWKRMIFFEDYEDKEVRRVGFVPTVTSQLDDREATTLNAFLSKDEKMQVVAPLLIPEKRIPRNDEIGRYNMIFLKETIKELQERAVEVDLFNKENLYKDTHKGGPAPAYTVDQWIIKDENDKAYTEYGFDQKRCPIGTWMIHSQITSKAYWEREIKENGKHSYSIEALINMTMIELSKHENKSQSKTDTKMEKDQIVLPDGEHLIDGKIYVVKGGSVIETKEVSDEQEETLKEVAEDSAKKDNAEEMSEAKEEDKKSEEMSYESKEEEKKSEEMAQAPEEKSEEMMKDKTEDMMEEKSEEKSEESTESEDEKIKSLEQKVDQLTDMIAEMKANQVEKSTEEKEIKMESQKKVPFWKAVSGAADKLSKK